MAPSLHFTMLSPRAVGVSSTDNITCARPLTNDIGEPLFKGNSLTLHQLMMLISGPCLVLTILSSAVLSWKHLHRYTAPQEQRQILRIVNLPIFYSLFNFLALCFYQDYLYIEPIAGVFEAFAVAALFLLVLEYACPDGTDREKYFDNLELHDRRGHPLPGGSLKWFQRTWSSTLQYPLSKLVFVIVQIVTQYYGVYCENSFSPKTAHLWLFIADILFIGGALGATIRFFRRLRKEIDPSHNGRAKVGTFVGIVSFKIVQGIIFHQLNGKLFSPTKTATYNDINFGIPSFMTCIEALIFSLLFQWSFRSREYREGTRLNRLGTGAAAPRTRTFHAIMDALNPSDIVAGTFVAIGLLFTRVKSRYGARSTAPYQTKAVPSVWADEGHLEPLSNQNRGTRSPGAESPEYSPALTTVYGNQMRLPSMPIAARDPSPGDRDTMMRTTREDNVLRPSEGRNSYQPLAGSRTPSPSDSYAREQDARSMV